MGAGESDLASGRGARLRARVDLRPPRLANAARRAVVRSDPDAHGRGRGDGAGPARPARRVAELPAPGAIREGARHARRRLGGSDHARDRRRRRRLGRDHARSRGLVAGRASGRFAEFVELLDVLLREPEVSFAGRYSPPTRRAPTPGCVQLPRIPFAIAATGPRGMRARGDARRHLGHDGTAHATRPSPPRRARRSSRSRWCGSTPSARQRARDAGLARPARATGPAARPRARVAGRVRDASPPTRRRRDRPRRPLAARSEPVAADPAVLERIFSR